jgi:hypothetical protein
MAYFDFTTPLSRQTTARAEALNALFQAIDDSFAELPDAAALSELRAVFALDTGTANAYAMTLAKAPLAYTTGMTIAFKAVNANTGASTINVNALGAKAIRIWDGSVLSANTILADQIVVAVYDGTVFRITSMHGGTSIATLAAIAPDIVTVSGISGNVTSVAGNATNINTVAGISGNVTTVAGISADVTTVAGVDAGDLAAVAGVQADIPTVAGISANVTTVAGLSAEVAALGPIAGDITTAAANVADITNFADVYLGAASSNPATRADSSALQAGDLYFNTVSDALFVYDGAAWQAAALDAGSFVVVANIATDAQLRAATTGKVVDALVIRTARAVATLTDGATITPDMNAGPNFTVTLGGNRTLENPTNQAAGQAGFIRVIQDGTGSRTLSYGTNWKFAGGAPTLSTAANSVDVIAYEVIASGTILATFAGEFS